MVWFRSSRLDPTTVTTVGDPIALADRVASDAAASVPAIAAVAGTIVYRTGPSGGQRQFVWFDRAGKELSRIGTPDAHGPSFGSLSPDRRRLAVQRTADGSTDIWLTQGIALQNYIVAPGGQQFLLDTVVEQTVAPISLIVNWNAPDR